MPPEECSAVDDSAAESLSGESSTEERQQVQDENGAAPFSPRVMGKALSRRLSKLERSFSIEPLQPVGSSGQGEEAVLSPEARATVPQLSLTDRIRVGITDTVLYTKLAAQLYSYLAGGFMWAINAWRLVLFALILLPGFMQMVIFYCLSPRLLRGIPYGIKGRNTLDIYVPRKRWVRRGPRPVVIFITGGAWTIGYKAWGALLGRRLSQRGVLVFCLDYRNFPQGNLPDMLEDVNTGISWVLNNAHLYCGDPSTVYITGQSAGAQLGALAMFAQVQQRVLGGPVLGGQPAWDPSKICGFVGVSGPYNMYALADHLHRRGLYKNILHRLMSVDGRVMMRELSPSYVVRKLAPEVAAAIPPVLLMHGTADKTVPMEIAVEFVMALKEAGVSARLKLYRGKTHTQPIVEDPMRSGEDELMDDILSLVTGKPEVHSQFPMLPSLVIDLASWVCPF